MSGVRVKQLAVGGWLVFERTIRALGIIHLLSLLLFIIIILFYLWKEALKWNSLIITRFTRVGLATQGVGT